MSRSSLGIVSVTHEREKARLSYHLTYLPSRHGGGRDLKENTPQVTARARAEATVVQGAGGKEGASFVPRLIERLIFFQVARSARFDHLIVR